MKKTDMGLINQASNIIDFNYEKKKKDHAASEAESERNLSLLLDELVNELYTLDNVNCDLNTLHISVGENTSNLELLFQIIEVQAQNIKQLLEFHGLDEIKFDISNYINREDYQNEQ